MRNQLRIAVVAASLAPLIGVMGSTVGLAQYKSGTQIVPLTVTVTDRSGRYVAGLPAAAFTIFEDGRRQTLAYFSAVDAPVDLALLLDNSSSMRSDFRLAQEAACGLARRMRTADRVALSGISSETFIAQPLTSDLDRVDQAIRTMQVFGPTAIYEGLYVLLRELQRAHHAESEPRRRAIVLLSDGLDTASRIEFDHVLDSVRRSDVVVYVILLERDIKAAINSDESSEAFRARFAMRSLARESGGHIFTPQIAGELPAIYDAIAHELRHQYLLGYTPERQDADGAFRRISVAVHHPAVVQARTRAGYYAVPTRTARAGAGDRH